MSEGLPTGWKVTELGALLTEISYGFTAKATQDEVGPKLLRITDLQNGRVNWDKVPFCVCDKISKYLLSEGDIVVARTGATTGKSYLLENIPFDAIYASYLIRLKPFNDTIGKYISRFMNSPDYWGQIQIVSKGIAQPGANASILSKLKIPIPPLQEQKRIAEKLDCLLAKVDACKARLDKVPEIIKRFRQSVLADAVSGKLTEDWEEKDKYYSKAEMSSASLFEIPNNWVWSKIEKIANVKGGKRLPKGEGLVKHNTGFPYIRAGQLKNGTVNSEDQRFLEPSTQEKIKRYIVHSGDVYITIVGACIGDSGLIPDDYHKANLTENAAKICDHKYINKNYLSIWLRSPIAQDYIKFLIKSGAQGKLALKRIKDIPIPVPSEEEQKEIVHLVEAMFSVADQLEEKLTNAKLRVDKLTASILSKAFRGELVPQDPNDEPAEFLLERIRAEREALAANKKKGKRTPKKKSSPKKETIIQTDDTDGEPAPTTVIQSETIQSRKKDKTAKLKQQPLAGFDRRFEKTDVLKAFRKAIFHQTDIDEHALLRLVGQRLGVRRLSRQIRQELESHIRTAMRRKIIARSDAGYTSATPTIQHYDDEDLIKILKSVIRNGYEYERSQVMNDAATYLGFDKVSDAFAERMKAIFRTAIRRGELYRSGNFVGKT